MFTDIAALSTVADHRHRELLAEAEQFRLGRIARAARRAAARRAPTPPPPRGVPPQRTRPESAGERRTLVPR